MTEYVMEIGPEREDDNIREVWIRNETDNEILKHAMIKTYEGHFFELTVEDDGDEESGNKYRGP